MNCQEFDRIVDSYLSDELLVETNHDVLRHLESCSGCRAEIVTRRELRARVGKAAKNAREFQINPVFSSRLATDLRNSALRPSFLDRIASINSSSKVRILAAGFACILIIVFGTLVWIRNSATPDYAQNTNADPQFIYPNAAKPGNNMARAIRASWNEMAHEAINDHKNCALEFRLLERPVSLDEAAKKYGRFNKDIDKVVISALRNSKEDNAISEAELLEAHSCIFAGRRFTHFVLRAKGKLVSVLVADSDLPAGDEIQSGVDDGNMHVAGKNIGKYTVFVVSELPDSENATIAATVSPAIRRHIEESGI